MGGESQTRNESLCTQAHFLCVHQTSVFTIHFTVCLITYVSLHKFWKNDRRSGPTLRHESQVAFLAG